jgi:hypothetical protein
MMAQPARKPDEPVYQPVIRRFDLADLQEHGGWIIPRLREAYPSVREGALAGWLKSAIYSNEHMFLYCPDGVAMAQVLRNISLEAAPFVQERFVWVRDKSDPEQVRSCARFYEEFHRWAKQLGCEVMFVEESSDVPHEIVKEKVGRVFTRTQQFVRM